MPDRTVTLNEIMEFDHVIRIDENGHVSHANRDDGLSVYAPSLYDEELDDNSWTLLDGYSGQCGYGGPIMHNSEYIGGGLERDILAKPGLYVVIAAYWSPENEDDDDDIEGWAVAYREA